MAVILEKDKPRTMQEENMPWTVIPNRLMEMAERMKVMSSALEAGVLRPNEFTGQAARQAMGPAEAKRIRNLLDEIGAGVEQMKAALRLVEEARPGAGKEPGLSRRMK